MKHKSLTDFTDEEMDRLEKSSIAISEAKSEEALHDALLEMMDVMGVEPLFRTSEEFDTLMRSNEPLVF